MKQNNLPKINEQSMLKFLSNYDSYFADAFDKNIVNTMINNINNDFPLLLNTGVVILSEDEIKIIKDAFNSLLRDLDNLSFINGFLDNKREIINNILKKI